jgi:hypothetical protein
MENTWNGSVLSEQRLSKEHAQKVLNVLLRTTLDADLYRPQYNSGVVDGLDPTFQPVSELIIEELYFRPITKTDHFTGMTALDIKVKEILKHLTGSSYGYTFIAGLDDVNITINSTKPQPGGEHSIHITSAERLTLFFWNGEEYTARFILHMWRV